jgi:hypothetical protein
MELFMNFRNENDSDLKIAGQCSLPPLDHGFMEKNRDLVVRIEEHNLRFAHAGERLKGLVEHRKRFALSNAWFDKEYAELTKDAAHLRQESWSALLGLRVALREREALLKEVFASLRDQCGTCDLAREHAAASAERRLAGERRALQKSHPSHAEAYFSDLIADDDRVRKLEARLAELRRAIDSNQDAQRDVGLCLGQLQHRQRELFVTMML